MFIFKISIPLDFNSAAGRKEENPSVCGYLLYLGPLFPVPLFCPVSYATTERLSLSHQPIARKKKKNQPDSNLFNREGGEKKKKKKKELLLG